MSVVQSHLWPLFDKVMLLKIILNRFIGSILLISGTSIGAGMLGLPIKILGINFYFNLIILFLLWLIMFFSALAMLEISLWVEGNSNLISIAKYILGINFSYFLAFVYILFLYSLISAYISGGSSILLDFFISNNNSSVYVFFFEFIFILPFIITIFFGIKFVDYINRIFFLGLIISYIILCFKFLSLPNVSVSNLNFFDKKMMLFALPIMITSFGYSLLIPSLKLYLYNNIKIMYIVFICGSLIPFIIYIIWEYLIYGFFINVGNKLFIQTLFSEGNPTEKLVVLISNNNAYFFYFIIIFSFFAISSSFIGVSLSMYDFFFDLFCLIKTKLFHKLIVLFLIFCFPLGFVFFFPYGFMFALSYAGVFASILLILFPVYILWYGRYIKKLKYKYILFDNKLFLYFIFFIGLLIIFCDIFEKYFI